MRLVGTKSIEDRFFFGCGSESFYPAVGDWVTFFLIQRMFEQIVSTHPSKAQIRHKKMGRN